MRKQVLLPSWRGVLVSEEVHYIVYHAILIVLILEYFSDVA